ncbi:hypothetical protein F4859DRAFT_510906 [Xylaria cf. heliscus]|nr:hypothetical protein F4859DRAFT_510906 [Xylaria cf. heliscus]
MDALKKVVGGGNHSTSNTNNPATGAGAVGQKDDYGDKGKSPLSVSLCAAFVNKKYLGNKFSHDQLENITDAGRGAFEKATGKHVPEKFSN